MAILRTETYTIPAKTIETVIVGIPAKDWRQVQVKSTLGFITYILTFIVAILGLMYVIALFSQDILHFFQNSVGLSVTATLFVSAIIFSLPILPGVYILRRFYNYLVSLQPNLIKRYGWDGSSNYRVELEYQQFMHE